MQSTAKLATQYDFRRLGDQTGVLTSEFSERVVHGELYCSLLDQSAAGRNPDAILDELGERFGDAVAQFALLDLRRQGVVEEAAGPAGVNGFWGLLGHDAASVRERLAAAHVRIIGLGSETSFLAQALRDCGIGHVEEEEEGGEPSGGIPTLSIVVAEDYLDPRLNAINARHLKNGRRWILCKPSGGRGLIGPLMIPGQTTCWACLAKAMRPMRGHAADAAHRKRPGAPDIARSGAGDRKHGVSRHREGLAGR